MITCMSNMKTSSSRFVYNIPTPRKNLRSRQKKHRDYDKDDDYVRRSHNRQSEFSSSPKVPPPSQAFNSVLCKLRFTATPSNVARGRRDSYVSDDELVTTTHGILTKRKSYPSRMYPSSSPSCQSAPASNCNTPKTRRTVRFDEATITSTAEFGETAARFRSLSRKKRCASATSLRTTSPPNPQSFGGSRNIIVLHKDDDVIDDFKRMSFTAAPLGTVVHGKHQRSIFDVCDVFTYTGRFT